MKELSDIIAELESVYGKAIRRKAIKHIARIAFLRGAMVGRKETAQEAFAYGHYVGFQYARENPNAVIVNPPPDPMHKYEVKYEETE